MSLIPLSSSSAFHTNPQLPVCLFNETSNTFKAEEKSIAYVVGERLVAPSISAGRVTASWLYRKVSPILNLIDQPISCVFKWVVDQVGVAAAEAKPRKNWSTFQASEQSILTALTRDFFFNTFAISQGAYKDFIKELPTDQQIAFAKNITLQKNLSQFHQIVDNFSLSLYKRITDNANSLEFNTRCKHYRYIISSLSYIEFDLKYNALPSRFTIDGSIKKIYIFSIPTNIFEKPGLREIWFLKLFGGSTVRDIGLVGIWEDYYQTVNPICSVTPYERRLQQHLEQMKPIMNLWDPKNFTWEQFEKFFTPPSLKVLEQTLKSFETSLNSISSSEAENEIYSLYEKEVDILLQSIFALQAQTHLPNLNFVTKKNQKGHLIRWEFYQNSKLILRFRIGSLSPEEDER